MFRYFLLALILGGCSGTAMESDSDTAPVCVDPYHAEVQFLTAVLKSGTICAAAKDIDTCLTPDDNCGVCEAVRCCESIEQWNAEANPADLRAFPPHAACLASLCPVCNSVSQ